MADRRGMPREPRRTRALSRLLRAAVLILLGLGLPVFWLHHARTRANVSFDRIATLPYEQATAEIARHGSNVTARFDGERAVASATGLAPGMGVGQNPRFVNIGTESASVYRGESGTWYLLGRFKILDYADGQWRTLGIVENQRYVYRPRGEGIS